MYERIKGKAIKEEKIMSDIRYLDGKVKCLVDLIAGKKACITYLESGKVGNKEVGYKEVVFGNVDVIAGVRRLWRNKGL